MNYSCNRCKKQVKGEMIDGLCIPCRKRSHECMYCGDLADVSYNSCDRCYQRMVDKKAKQGPFEESFDPRSIARLLSEDIRENNGFLLEAWDSRRPNDYLTTRNVEELMGHGARKASEMVLDRVYEQTFHRSWPNFKASYIEIARKHGEQSLPENERKKYVTMRDAQLEIEELLNKGEHQQAIDYAIKTVSDLAAS